MMPTVLARLSLSSFLLAAFATTALATDYYVDVVNGNNANSGTTPSAAWKTLTFAIAATQQTTSDTIHVAPGTYSAASGESFPLQVSDQEIVGDLGAALTIVDGGRQAYIFRLNAGPAAAAGAPHVSIAGLTLRNADNPVGAHWMAGHLSASLRDLVIEGAVGVGLGFSMSPISSPTATYAVRLERIRTDHCATGVAASAVSGQNQFEVVDCEFKNCARGATVNGSVRAQLERCRITDNGEGVSVFAALGTVSAALRDCLIANNGRGLTAGMYLASGNATLDVQRCTIAKNSQLGIGSIGPSSIVPSFHLESVLCWGNGVDYSNAAAPTGSFTQISGPDPLFRDSAQGDFRVNFGSPVIDSGDPATVVGTLDLNGVARSVDGDLDTLERADIGCFEFRTLDMTTSGQQGTLLTLEIFGGLAGSSAMRLTRGPLSAPVMTQFGEFDLNLGSNLPWVTFPTAPGPGFLFQRAIPTTPTFIGQTYSFQGLVRSGASPLGAAWSNAVSFTIVP